MLKNPERAFVVRVLREEYHLTGGFRTEPKGDNTLFVFLEDLFVAETFEENPSSELILSRMKEVGLYRYAAFVLPKPNTRRYTNKWGSFTRPLIETPFSMFVQEIAQLSTCTRLKVGALIVTPSFDRVLCYGYNGSYVGGPNGCESLEPGACGCIHAEMNAVAKATESLSGCVCVSSVSPCINCAKVLINRQISKVLYVNEYRDMSSIDLLKSVGIECGKLGSDS